jgi:hypothetical protein
MQRQDDRPNKALKGPGTQTFLGEERERERERECRRWKRWCDGAVATAAGLRQLKDTTDLVFFLLPYIPTYLFTHLLSYLPTYLPTYLFTYPPIIYLILYLLTHLSS